MSKKITIAERETEKFFRGVERRPGYLERAAAFDVEYGVALALQEARARARLSQKELAEQLGTTQSVISRMESGRANISLAKLQEYAEACGGRLEVKIAF
jgi:ribosome-binding protein aMBF1 (putative translation factor)